MKVIITGASGMVGRGVLLECLESPHVEKVLTVNRSPLGISHPKNQGILAADFLDLTAIEKELAGYDACFFCAGTTAVGKTEEAYHRITYDLTLHFAETFLKQGVHPKTFCYVTGQGTDSTEKGRAMWARVKGKTENALLRLPFKAAYMFRPWYIQPLKGIQSKTEIYEMFYSVFRPVYAILKNFPGAATDTTRLGKAMIYAALQSPPEKILRSREINRFAEALDLLQNG